MLQVDFDVGPGDVQELKNPDSVTGFFAKLGYDTNKRVVQNPQHLGISNQTLLDQIKRVERIAENGSLKVYLLELSSVTVANTLLLSRSFKEMSGLFILVLTSDYERIDFILLERVVPLGKKFTVTTKPRFTLRPRNLTVNRSNLDNVSMRVLKRLTFTEGDEFAQYDKIRSAYTMADWAEEHFNNRALFSDYFLIHRLKDDPVWKEKAEPSFLFFKNTLKPFSYQWHNIKEKEFLSKFIEQVLTELGFDHEKTSRTSDDLVRPHYNLFTRRDKKKVGAVLSYVWGRNLDAKDYTRDSTNPEENPSQAVVTVLEEEKVPWVIVTNGKVWRLYSAKAHSRATNYYEIDLEETIALNDPSEAFRYYWLLFREAAFVPQSYVIEGKERTMSFLDKLLYDSQDYSRELEERLKAKVFEEVFPFFAEGFLENIGGKEKLLALSEDKRDEICKEVFSTTLTILYRILFLLYAESRDLLPVKEVRGYFEKSLTKLKKEIAEKAGNIADGVESKLKSRYIRSNTELYDRLMELAEIIDKGKSSLNVPTYNGGLFLSEPTGEDDTREAEIARFLSEYKMPDIYFARGLDKLARDEDPKRCELVPIDYKSLGIRQLGSIYEGLLEFSVRIAPEKMAVVKGKKTEQIVPYSDAVEKKLKILTIGRGSEKREYTLPRGTVYIENDKKERKATGSYYTPDYIVKYIVDNTVGPVLEEKFKEVRPKLRRLRSDQLETEAAKEIIDELFDIHVLDPAMGSGHFLVETVDYITDKMLDFLNGFPNNPVQLELQKIRDTIMDEMNNQSVSIDQNELIDVSLMKRCVLKRCVYGVDLNPMAVELAKVSLWLDCFTIGGALSFLDHHLKCGNSLIGSNLEDVMKKIDTGQMTWGAISKFGGLKRASEHMIHVGELSDITFAMVEESKREYNAANKEIGLYKEVLDIYTSRWFSNQPITVGKGRRKTTYDYALEFLRSEEISEWIIDTTNTKILNEEQKEIIKNTYRDYGEKLYFHWDLEFPEIFYKKSTDKKGFDVVVGNPPYISYNTKGGLPIPENEYPFYQNTYKFLTNVKSRARLNSIMFFIERGLRELSNNNRLGFIVNQALLGVGTFKHIRRYIFQKSIIDAVVTDVAFEDVIADTCIIILKNNHNHVQNNRNCKIRWVPDIFKQKKEILIEQNLFSKNEGYEFIFNENLPLLNKIEGVSKWLGKLSNISRGMQITKEEFLSDEKIDERYHKCLSNDNGDRYAFIYPSEQQLDPNKGRKKYVIFDKKIEEKVNENLEKIGSKTRVAIGKTPIRFLQPKIFVRQSPPSTRLCAFYDDENFFSDYTLHVINRIDLSLKFILSLLNSKLLSFFAVKKGLLYTGEKRTPQLMKKKLEQLPIRNIFFNTTLEIRDDLVKDFKLKYQSSRFGEILSMVEECLPKDKANNLIIEKKSDVIYDLLEFLAEQIIEKNNEKSREVRKFLSWLELAFGVNIDDLSNKSKLKEFYDYDFEDFYLVLKKNKNKISNVTDEKVKQDLLTEFQKTMKKIVPLLDRIKSIDDLIDQIVYKLYGLTDEEIEIVEKSVGGR